MKGFVVAIILALTGGVSFAAGEGSTFPHDSVNINLENSSSLQRGARLFVNYCMGCHSAQYMRYSRMAEDIGISEEALMENLIFDPNTKKGDMMVSSMRPEDGERWFGAAPPDLTVIARSRGADYLYNYLRGFYLDDSAPLGVSNSVKVVSMPHALWELQGWNAPEIETTFDEEGNEHQAIVGFESVQAGSLQPGEYDRAVADLVNFMVYMGEPVQLERRALGIWVIVVLLLASVLFYLLKKEYWRDVH